MTDSFLSCELCLLADMLCDNISISIKRNIDIDYTDCIYKLKNNKDYGGYGIKWGVDTFVLANKLSRTNNNNLHRLTIALKNYWEPYDKEGIELNMYEWAKSELNNW